MYSNASKDLKNHEKPALFFNFYPHALKEVNRRLLFNAMVRPDIWMLNSVLKAEIAERKKFLSDYSELMPDTFLKALHVVP